MNYDNIILEVGNFGWYQRRILLVFTLPAIACAYHTMGAVFLMATPDFRCMLPNESSENATYQSPPNITSLQMYPWNDETKTWPQCERYDPDFEDTHHSFGENLTSTIPTVKCDSVVYDKTYYTQTVTTEWNLVCDNAWLKTLSDSLLMVGDIPGSVICGTVSDRYGRKTALLWGSIMQLIFAVLMSISPNFSVHAVLRILIGATGGSLFFAGYIAAIEMAGPHHRATVGIVGNLLYTLGYILSAGLAYFIRNWRYLQIVFTVPTVVLLIFIWFVPESPRWLLTKGRVQEAKDILQKISLSNGRELSSEKFEGLLSNNGESESATKKPSVIDLLRYPNLRKKSLSLFFIWFTASITYYGLSWNTSNLGGDDYINFGIAAVVEVPACLGVIFTLDRWGRRNNLSGCMLLCGISLLFTFFVPIEMTWLMITLTMLGKFAITCTWGVIYVFTAELYPTAVRNVGVAACTVFGNIGSTLTPQISYLFGMSTYLALIILGACSFIGGLLSLRLPETLNTELPETIEDVENPGENRSNTQELVSKQLNDSIGLEVGESRG